jgi:hypothetical protein
LALFAVGTVIAMANSADRARGYGVAVNPPRTDLITFATSTASWSSPSREKMQRRAPRRVVKEGAASPYG